MLLLRRAFLALPAVALVGAERAAAKGQGLEQFGSSAPPCAPDQQITPAVPDDGAYRPGAPRRSSLVEPGATGTRLTLEGTVSGVTCGRIQGATVDFWQADPQGRYDPAGFRWRGHQVTDGQGRYRLVTIVPGAGPGRAPHLGVRVRVSGKADFWTEIFFPNHPLNARDRRYRPELVMKTTADGATFDITLKL